MRFITKCCDRLYNLLYIKPSIRFLSLPNSHLSLSLCLSFLLSSFFTPFSTLFPLLLPISDLPLLCLFPSSCFLSPLLPSHLSFQSILSHSPFINSILFYSIPLLIIPNSIPTRDFLFSNFIVSFFILSYQIEVNLPFYILYDL